MVALASAVPGAGAAAAACGARAVIAGHDDWCETWATNLEFDPVLAHVSDDGATTYALVTLRVETADRAIAVIDNDTGAVRQTWPIVPHAAGARTFWPRTFELDRARGVLFVVGTLTGRVETDEGFWNYSRTYVAAYSVSGAPLWQTMYDAPSGAGDDYDYPTGSTVAPDGSSLYLTVGSVRDDAYGLETAALDAATGALQWRERFTSEGLWMGSHGIVAAPDGTTVYVVTLRGTGVVDVLAYETTGAPAGARLRWMREEASTSFAYARGGVRVAGDGTIIVSGYDLSGEFPAIAVLALGADGGRRWLSSVAQTTQVLRISQGPELTDWDVGLRETPTGGVPLKLAVDGSRAFVFGIQGEWDAQYGTTTPTPAIRGVTIAVDVATGTAEWQRVYRFPADRVFFPTAGFAAAGRAVITGIASDCNFYFRPPYQCTTEVGYNTVTVAYDQQTGEQTDVARYNHAWLVPDAHQPSTVTGTSFDFQLASALGPDGTFVTAASTSPGWCSDCSRRAASYMLGYRE